MQLYLFESDEFYLGGKGSQLDADKCNFSPDVCK